MQQRGGAHGRHAHGIRADRRAVRLLGRLKLGGQRRGGGEGEGHGADVARDDLVEPRLQPARWRRVRHDVRRYEGPRRERDARQRGRVGVVGGSRRTRPVEQRRQQEDEHRQHEGHRHDAEAAERVAEDHL